VMLVATPGLLLLGLRWPRATLAGSVLLWALAGQFRLNFPNYPTSGGWFFNPLSWQLLFVVGLLSGVMMKQGRRLVPLNSVLLSILAAFLLIVLLWVKIEAVGDAGRNVLGSLSDLGLPFYLTWFDKTFLALPRLAHALALFYVLSALAPIRGLAATRAAAPLRLMGRHGLAVFATGTVLSLALQALRVTMEPDLATDTLMIGGGLLGLWALAWALSTIRRAAPAQSLANQN